MAWRVARSLLTLRDQVDAAAPNRSKQSDGTIGDAAHASRSSDHNPHVRDGATGIVTAIDITHDPAGGADMGIVSEAIRRSGDPRRKYVIFNRRIASASSGWAWRAYGGSNPHINHMHLSVQPTKALYDGTRAWSIGLGGPAAQEDDVVRFRDSGEHVEQFQKLLNEFMDQTVKKRNWKLPAGVALLEVDGDFGPITRAMYQHAIGRAQSILDQPSMIGGHLDTVGPIPLGQIGDALRKITSTASQGPKGDPGPPGTPGITAAQVRQLVDGARIEGVVKLSG